MYMYTVQRYSIGPSACMNVLRMYVVIEGIHAVLGSLHTYVYAFNSNTSGYLENGQ